MTSRPPTALEVLLARDHLAPGIRLLVVATATIGRGDWDGLAAATECARDRRFPRSDLEEALLQAILFFGFPRVITAFQTVEKVWPTALAPSGGALPANRQRGAGESLFDRIYGRNAEAVHAMLRGYHHELHDFVIEAAYGRVLSRPGLAPRERELLAVAALSVLDQIPQLVAHARGAQTFGATSEELREVLITSLGDVPLVVDLLRRVGRPAQTL